VIPWEEALATVLAGCRPLAPQRVPWREALLGQVLASPVVAAAPVPPFANTAMDGYAVRAADVATVPVRLPVVAVVGAGHPTARRLSPGEAMRIFTGAPIPEGADAIVIVENTSRVADGAEVEIHEPAVPGAHIRPAGDDVAPGDVVISPGVELTAGRLGAARSVGAFVLELHPRPRVGVLSTGDELVPGDGPLGPGQIYDSNRPTLLALVASAGAVPVDLGHAGDDEAAITATISRGFETCDMVLSTGGVSMGDTDLVKVVLDRLAGSAMRWMQVAIRPAKPLAFGVVGGVPMVGLPGNPVSSMVSFELFARPGLRRRAGYPDSRLQRPRLRAVADEPLTRRSDGKVVFVRVVARVIDGQLRVRSAGGQGSHQLSAMARANALAVLPDGPGVDVDEEVEVLLLGDL
jgi:molybdenum cofactor synthesis domain-containing protein